MNYSCMYLYIDLALRADAMDLVYFQLYLRLFPSSQRTLEVSVYFQMCPQLFPKSLGIHTPFSLHTSASYQPLRKHSALEVI
jgi:hypothetical protein